MSDPSPSPEVDTQHPVVPDPLLTVSPTIATVSVQQDKQGEEEALESHEVIELQAFSEKKPWIEERIRVSALRRLPR